jgi:hydroxymethylbilane synthase
VQSSSAAVHLRIGTRASPLALHQAEQVRAFLLASSSALTAELVALRTSGDRIQDRPLAEAGGKGLFAKEIEQALLAGAIDLAVHSAKDLPTWLPDGLMLAACLQREDVRDAFISRKAAGLLDLAPGSQVGTASPRRQALVKRLRPDLRLVNFRGNVETRLRKLEAGVVDGTLLALAGLKRLNLAKAATAILPVEEFPPAVGQGAIAIELRIADARTRDLVALINDHPTMTAVAAERAYLGELDGSCRTPIAGHASVSGGVLRFFGMVLAPDGSQSHAVTREADAASAVALGADAGRELRRRAGPGFFRVTT